ncbi:unnamed protein product [Cylindrotheca closterium]|uniref:Glutamate/phenylalanine/leucine/valine/L-tryptophan dehydrogenase C-terminal domain-containing protein n=1 Tax=Cylindrotheca closterium TaxID=2856 RepID=A0AAD2GDL5_9STRA|nr:unnamed protein product [Cylindrotheca closterium]
MMLSRSVSKALAALPSTTRGGLSTVRVFSSAPNEYQQPKEPMNIPKNSLITSEDGVHQTVKVSKTWRNKPLFRRQGDVRFKTGMEASNLIIREALRRDAHEAEYIESLTATLQCLSPIFDRNPKYAFVAKTLIEPERFLQFRVAWIDDLGINRLNRGWRVQYSSALGPYSGSLHFGPHMTHSVVHCLGFDQVFANAVTGFPRGSAVGGSDFNPLDKSEGELQRFCQSYMTELAKYIGPDQDVPWMGEGVGQEEMGFMLGQYKRIIGQMPANFLSSSQFESAPGFGLVHFGEKLLQDKGDSLKGKRCLIIGAGKVARSVAQKLLEYGAVPITLSDASGHVYEPEGITEHKLSTIDTIKSERGALLGRYVMSSTTAQFNKPENLLDIPCDICIPCGEMHGMDEAAVNAVADLGCKLVLEGGQECVTPAARKVLKKRGVLYGPHTMTMSGPAIVHSLGPQATDEELKTEVDRIYQEIKTTANEFNCRGDLFAGANIAGFLRIANQMLKHGAV